MRSVDRAVILAAAMGLGAACLALWLSARCTTAVAAGVAGFGLAYAGALWLLKPLAAYVAFIERLADGEFDEEAPPARERRFAPLARALEAMRLHLRAWMGQIARSAIEFEGSLQVLDLVHVMHFLRAGKRSGTLVLQRGGEVALQFWKGGEVVGALCGRAAGLEALLIPFGWERGSFKFSPRLDPTVNLNARWEVLLLAAVRSVDNPRKWGRLVPKPSTVVRRTGLADHMPVRHLLTPGEWAALSAVGNESSAEEVARRLGEPVHKTWHALYCLSALGLIEPVDQSALTGFAAALPRRAEPAAVSTGVASPGALSPETGRRPAASSAAGSPALPAAAPGQERALWPGGMPQVPNVIPLEKARGRRR